MALGPSIQRPATWKGPWTLRRRPAQLRAGSESLPGARTHRADWPIETTVPRRTARSALSTRSARRDRSVASSGRCIAPLRSWWPCEIRRHHGCVQTGARIGERALQSRRLSQGPPVGAADGCPLVLSSRSSPRQSRRSRSAPVRSKTWQRGGSDSHAVCPPRPDYALGSLGCGSERSPGKASRTRGANPDRY